MWSNLGVFRYAGDIFCCPGKVMQYFEYFGLSSAVSFGFEVIHQVYSSTFGFQN